MYQKNVTTTTSYSSSATVKSIVAQAKNEGLSLKKSLQSKSFSPPTIKDLVVECAKAGIICFCMIFAVIIICYIQYSSGVALIKSILFGLVVVMVLAKRYWSTFYVAYMVTREK